MKPSFTPAALPDNEEWRLQSLRDLNVLDTAPEAEFDALVKVASMVCGVPISLISLVDADRQWFKADVGLGAVQTPRDVAFCAHAILDDQIFEVEDARLDERFAGSPLVQGAPDIRFYAGAPITLASGARVGTLCVIDREPKKLTAMQREVLQNLGIAASQALEARRILSAERNRAVIAAHDDAVEKARITQSKLELALQQASALASAVDIHAIVSEVDRNGFITNCNESFERISGYIRDELIGQNHRIVNSGHHPQSFWAEMWGTISAGTPWRGEICNRTKGGQVYWVDSMIAPFIGDDGFVEKYVSIRTDITKRVEDQRKLDKMSLRLKLAVEGGSDGLWDWPDVSQEAQWWSPSYYAILGYGDSELPPSSNSYLSILHPDFAEISRRANTEAIAGTRQVDLEVQLKTKDRGYRWFRVRGKAGPDAQGVATRMAGSTQDVHERKIAELALISSKQLLEESQAIVKVGGWELNLRTGVLFWTDETYRIHETSPDKFNPTVDAGVGYFLPESKRIISEALEAAISRGEGYDLELETYTTQGRLIDVRTTCTVTMEGGKAVKLTGIFQDITERKRFERELQNARNRIELATQSGGIGIWVFDVVQNKLQWDDRMYALYGLTKQSALEPYSVWADCVHPDDRVASEKTLQEALEGTREFDTEFRIVWADQSIHYIRGTARVERDKAGQPLRMVGVNFDITNQKEQASALRAAKELAEELAKSKGQFLANMSHEIRTPMNAILGMLQLLNGTDLNARQMAYAEKTEGAARSLLGILNDILDFSKVDAGKMQLDPEPFALDRLVEELGTIVAGTVGAKPVELLIDVDPRIPNWLVGDALRLKQVLINLAGNAVKFTARGQVVIRVKNQAEGTLRFEVQDSGIGMSAEQASRVFAGFSQADASIARRFGGTGLGLAISQRLVTLMGGELAVSTAEGLGSTFYFEVALPQAMQASLRAGNSALPSGWTNVRALVFHQDEMVANHWATLCQQVGWQPKVTLGHDAALAALEQSCSVGEPKKLLLLNWQSGSGSVVDFVADVHAVHRRHGVDALHVLAMTNTLVDPLAELPAGQRQMVNAVGVKPLTPGALRQMATRN